MTLRVLVVDDHPLFREGLAALLHHLPIIDAVAQAATGRQAVEKVAELAPDVVLMDLHMPEMDGVEATRRIVADRPRTAVLVLSMLEDDASIFEAVRAGARWPSRVPGTLAISRLADVAPQAMSGWVAAFAPRRNPRVNPCTAFNWGNSVQHLWVESSRWARHRRRQWDSAHRQNVPGS